MARRLGALLEDGPADQIELIELREALSAEREERIRLGGTTEGLRRELVESQSFAGQLRASLSALQAERAALAERAASLQGDRTQSLREGEVRAALETSLAEVRDSLVVARGEIERLQDEQAKAHL